MVTYDESVIRMPSKLAFLTVNPVTTTWFSPAWLWPSMLNPLLRPVASTMLLPGARADDRQRLGDDDVLVVSPRSDLDRVVARRRRHGGVDARKAASGPSRVDALGRSHRQSGGAQEERSDEHEDGSNGWLRRLYPRELSVVAASGDCLCVHMFSGGSSPVGGMVRLNAHR